MLIALVTASGVVRLVYRDEEEVCGLLARKPDLNFFYLTTDVAFHVLTEMPVAPHQLVDCWCGGA